MGELVMITKEEAFSEIVQYVAWMDVDTAATVWEQLAIHGAGWRPYNVKRDKWNEWEEALGQLLLNRVLTGRCAEKALLHEMGETWPKT